MPNAYLSALSEAPKADVLREVERQMDRVERLRAALKQATMELEEAGNLLHGVGLHGSGSIFAIAAEKARSAGSVSKPPESAES